MGYRKGREILASYPQRLPLLIKYRAGGHRIVHKCPEGTILCCSSDNDKIRRIILIKAKL